MKKEGIDVYLGSRLRTMSWTTDAFFPWRSFIVIPSEGLPTAFTFVIDAARAADDSWLDEDHVLGFAPMGGQDQISQIAYMIEDLIPNGGVVGVEAGMSNYLPEGNLTWFEYKSFEEALSKCKLVNAHHIIDKLSIMKDEGTVKTVSVKQAVSWISATRQYSKPLKTAAGRAKPNPKSQVSPHWPCAGRGSVLGVVLHRRQRNRMRLPHRLCRRRVYSRFRQGNPCR